METKQVRQLNEDPTLGRRWLVQMDRACQKHNVTIQLCMSQMRHVLQSVEMPTVTNARASPDFGGACVKHPRPTASAPADATS